MATFNMRRARRLLQQSDFSSLFIEELGWPGPAAKRPFTSDCDGVQFQGQRIAELSGIVVIEITSPDGKIPDSKTRDAIHRAISSTHLENLLIFVDQQRKQSLWYWIKRESGKRYARPHHYFKGQPGDLFLSKLSPMFVDISELDDSGNT